MYRVALWGLGEGYNVFTSCHGYEMVEVVAIADKKGKLYKQIDGIPIVVPQKLACEYEYDYLIVTVVEEHTYKEIVREAVSMGIKREVIFPVRIFQIPFFNFDKYIQIKQSNISILSDYCFAGFLYHRFGLQFTSPTINMFTDNDNYYRFLQDIKSYMSAQMVKVENEVENVYKDTYTYPRGRIKDVEWVFNHDVNYETAAERWKRGVERFNYDNFIAVMTIRSDEMAYKFNELPIEHKIGFYWKDLGLDSVIYMPEWQDENIRAMLGYNFSGLTNRVADGTYGIQTIDWMKALLHEEGYCRIS